MTDTTPAAIEALTEWATKGPWWHDNNEGYGANNIWSEVVGDDYGKEIVASVAGDSAEAEANARFIAAARDLVPALAAELATARAERDVALLREAALLANNEAERQTLIRHNASHATELAALRKEVARMREAMARTADQARSGEIPDGYGPASTDDWDAGYDAAITFARAALTAEPLGHGVTADDSGGEA